jgi:signal transduction histidine kinase
MLYFYNARVPGDDTPLEFRVPDSPQSVRRDRPLDDVLRAVRLLGGLAGRLSRLQDPEALQETALAQAQAIFRCRAAAVCLWDRAADRLRTCRAVGRAADVDLRALSDLPAVRRTVIDERQPLAPAEVTVPADGEAWPVAAVVPISGEDDLLGLLVLGDPEAGREFGEADRALMAAAGRIVAMAAETSLLHARFRGEMERRIGEAQSELTRAAAELARLKTFNEELFQSVPVGFVVFDRDFRITFRNAAAQRLWAPDRNVLDGVRRTDAARIDPEWEASLREVLDMRRPWLAEAVTLGSPDPKASRLNLACSPLMSQQGDVVGGVLVVEDVTHRLRMQQRLEVSERLAGVGRLAAMVAHEINNPLDGMQRLLNLSSRAAEGGQPERLGGYLDQVRTGLARIGTIVRDLLDFSRSASGTVDPMGIREILTEATRTMQPAADEAGVAVAVDCADDLPPLKSGHLYHAVLNLVKNAVEATPDGGQVSVRGRCTEDTLVIEVADTGPGIPEDALPRLFEPFYSQKAIGKGTGLGLVISRDLVQKQGGTLSAANGDEGGAVFTIRVPLAPGAEA